ncbi:MAG: fatty acid desaturase [Gammaproteobacteria bacterium]|nr:fatty acid desaturase [Gammaproteobacteria bacterium]
MTGTIDFSGPWTAQSKTLYPALKRKLKRAGCFDPVPWLNLRDMSLVLSAYALGYAILLLDPAISYRLFALVMLAFASVHAGFIVHDAGHGIITRHRGLTKVIGHFFLTFLTGMSYDEFLYKHRRHHSHCNEKAIVPKGRTGLFSLREEVIENRFDGTAYRPGPLRALFNRYLAYLIWFLVSLKGSAVKIDGIRFALRRPKNSVMYAVFLTLHSALWLGVPVYFLGPWDTLVNYLLLTWFGGIYIGTIFLLNHFATRIIPPDQRPHYFEQQIVTTRNLGSSWLDNFLFGGFNNHIEHHLFPTMPKSKLVKARSVTRAFCRRHGVPYRESEFRPAIREIFQHFNSMARPDVTGSEGESHDGIRAYSL